MILPLTLCMIAGITFMDQEVPHVRTGEINPLTGRTAVNFLQTDVDGDGVVDLVLPGEVLFQRNGGFPPENRAVVPDADADPFCDVWEDTIYLRLSDGLKVVRWKEGDWETALEQSIEWHEPETVRQTSLTRSLDEAPTGRPERFLHDFDGDDVPEIVLASSDGLHVYSRDRDRYTHTARLDVFPPLTVTPTSDQALWPPERRRIALPARQMACRFFVSGANVTVLTAEDLPGMLARYHVIRYPVDPADGYAIDTAGVETETTEPMPNYIQPCRLNGDERIDYAGGDWQLSEASALPTPIYETFASLDGGLSTQAMRSRSFRPHCSFVDFDGDGDLDMVAESTGLFDGGIRETVSRFLTSRAVEHTVQVRFQDARGIFSPSPDVSGSFTVHLDQPPFRNGDLFRRYLAAELFNITGDFNGDGYHDMVVQDGARRLAVYLSVGREFPQRPHVTLPINEDGRFGVADVNGDALSDIVIQSLDTRGGEESRVFFAREDEP